MRYLIENKVIYDSDSGDLIILSTGIPEKQRLTHTANQVLSRLITSHGKVVERHCLLKEVWGANGQQESNSSLNQYISILRKTLTTLIDIDDVIITSPRVGFFLSPKVNVKLYNHEGLRPLIVKKLPSRFLTILSVSVALLIIALTFNINYFISLKKTEKILGNIEQCNVISNVRIPKHMTKTMIEIIKETHPELKKKCDSTPAKLMIYIQENIFYGMRGDVFLSFCPVNKENNMIIYCDNFYTNEWGYND